MINYKNYSVNYMKMERERSSKTLNCKDIIQLNDKRQ